MLILNFRFLAGRYHATPWGSHVNEGLVEWPPSPWRVVRALLAVGFSRLGWSEVPSIARSLVEKLTCLPTMYVPPARAAHTRHYMPTNDKTTKVIDTFAYVGDRHVSVVWDVEVSPAERTLIIELARSMPYLGRAESWVECTVSDEIGDGLAQCDAAEACPAPGLERVALLGAEPGDVYAAWRNAAVERERDTALAKAIEKAQTAGKSPPKSIPSKELAKIDTLFPIDIVQALCADTGRLREQGWSQPPGSRWVSYWRPLDALSTAPTPHVSRRARVYPTTALFALASDTRNGDALPPLRDAVWRMEALHDALVRLSDHDGGAPSPVFTGHDGDTPMRGHIHASLLPLTLDRRVDRIDHVLVHAPMGFDDGARAALAALRRTWAKGLPTLYVTLVGIGAAADFAKLVPDVATSSVWTSRTPFVPPRHPKPRGKNTIEGQVRAELTARGFPEPSAVDILDQRVDYRWFRRARRDATRQPKVSLGLGVRLEFANAVHGPIAIGYASHFGLGMFSPTRP